MTDDQRENPKRALAPPRSRPEVRLPDWRAMLLLANTCPRCGARTRAGMACKGPAMRNGRCRMHGGASTGPRTAEGLARIRKARTRTGLYSAEMMEMRRLSAELREEARLLLMELE
jgi:hypothetical protein